MGSSMALRSHTSALCMNFVRQHPSVLGLNNVNVPHLVTVMVEALVAGVVPEPTTTRMVRALKAALENMAPTLKSTIWASISPEKQKALQDLNFL